MDREREGGGLRRERHFDGRDMLCFRDRPRNALAFLARAAARGPEDEAIVAGGRRIGWRALSDLVDRTARGLLADGIRPGDRVAVLLRNRPEFAVALLGAIRAGAIAVPVNIREQTDELAYVLADCGAAALVHEPDLAGRLPAPARTPALRRRYAAGEGGGFDALAAAGAAGPPLPPPTGEEEATAILLYTSGTTGRPKGAMLTHLNLVHSILHYMDRFDLGPADRSVLVVPASHVTGIVAILLSMMGAGGCAILEEGFDAPAFLDLAARERMTHTVMVPAMYNLCLLRADFAARDLSAWRIGAYGGAPMPEATIAALADALPNLRLANAYGATETTSPVTISPPGGAAARPDSVGRPVACAEIRVVDEDGADVPPGAAGEILIGGPMVVPGYWGKPEATRAGFADGRWRSGDIGSLDAGGWLCVFDRKKDTINRGGYKVYSAEVENVLARHPAIAEAAVVPRPCPVLGERVHCFATLAEPPGAPDEAAEELRAFCAARMASHKVPETFTLLRDPLPRNANGKTMKRLLAARLAAEDAAAGGGADDGGNS